MKRFPFIIVLILAALAAASVQAADVGVSVSVSEPGFYGRIDIGDVPRPELIYARPVVIQPAPVHVVREPVYLHVPPGHAKKWRKHCHRYHACDRPVYFVKERWYRDVYVPHRHASARHYERGHGGKHGHNGHGKGDKGHGRGHGRD